MQIINNHKKALLLYCIYYRPWRRGAERHRMSTVPRDARREPWFCRTAFTRLPVGPSGESDWSGLRCGAWIGRASAGARATRRGEGGGGGPPARRRRAQVKSMKPQLLVVHGNAAFSHKPYVHQCMACAHALNNCWSYSKKKLLSENMTDTRQVHGMDCGPTY